MTRLLVVSCTLAALACIPAPNIVMVDRATALEQQAAGSFDELERRLTRTGIVPRPVPLTPEQLESLGIQPATLMEETEPTDADRIDDLLRQHCVGEAREGLLVDTHRDCRSASDRAATIALVDRVNRARAQLWRWMSTERRDTAPGALQRTWQRIHAQGIVCGAWIQHDDGTWGEKKC
ncbi:MAG TPA: DUF1318 domain-containing protein [Anaeromyxobacteraceae bacterium]|nr:DUF1318 domain-containing protein [Anaeromyxobacteraceae bacterium]